jgi:hypothetical protein
MCLDVKINEYIAGRMLIIMFWSALTGQRVNRATPRLQLIINNFQETFFSHPLWCQQSVNSVT